MGRIGMDGCVGARRAPRDAWPPDASLRRRSCGGDQHPAVPLGCALRPSGRLPCPDLEVLRLDVAVAEREASGPGAVLVEERRLEPLSLFRRIDRCEEVLPRWKP